MKVIQSVSRYFPDHCGGVQANLRDISAKLKIHRIESEIVAPWNERKEKTYSYDDVTVHRYPLLGTKLTSKSSSDIGIESLTERLKVQQADIYHQHSWGSRCGLTQLRLAKSLGMATVLTVHDALPICLRHTLMLHDEQACDGKIDKVRCSRCCCVLQSLPTPLIGALSHMPPSITNRIPVPQSIRTWTNYADFQPKPVKAIAGSMIRSVVVPTYVTRQQYELQQISKLADRIVAVCEWLYKALLINGVPEEKLVLSRCGVSDLFQNSSVTPKSETNRFNPLNVGFLGRWDANKGIHVVVKAVKNLPADIPLRLTIHGIPENESYRQQILDCIADDSRIHVAPPLRREALPSALAIFDVLAVSSQCLETGPLVILEAHASGTPVLGSNLGGIAELVRHNIDGLLVEPQDVKAWSQALAMLATNRDLLDRLKRGIQPVRTLEQQAEDLAMLYESLLP